MERGSDGVRKGEWSEGLGALRSGKESEVKVGVGWGKESDGLEALRLGETGEVKRRGT